MRTFARRLDALESTVSLDDVIERYAQETAKQLAASLKEMDRRSNGGGDAKGEDYDPAPFVDRLRRTMREGLHYGTPSDQKFARARLEPFR